jgi:hypothetical protein
MNNFKDLENIWNSQESDGEAKIPEQLMKRIKKSEKIVNNSHIYTIIILMATILMIGVGYLLIFKESDLISILGISAMILSLAIRIAIEFVSYKRVKELDVLKSSSDFAKELAEYYLWRRKIHGYPTYLTVLAYIAGVSLLFVKFKMYLSAFWFNFFLIELIIIAIVLFLFIRKKLRKEMKTLGEMVEIYEGI